MGIIKDSLQFRGQWRSYQKRVLDNALRYGQDRKIHIVAAPGSGKTTLGIELIRRLDAPCLILAPSVTIRDQWLARIREGFLPEEGAAGNGTADDAAAARGGAPKRTPDNLLSNSIRRPALITAITYQALHSCMRREKLEEERREQDSDTEKEDYSGFDFYKTIADLGIRTICLDEAHHLRSEWWKALEELAGRMTGVTMISLTATPPYDSTPAQWQRYIGLCGPIDEEISIPELVKENSLCPHQDYVYFNMPTEEEKQEITAYRGRALECAKRLMADDTFASHVAGHKGLADPDRYADALLGSPEYLSALLIFLRARNIAFPPKLLKLSGTKGRLPEMNLHWMELLLQGFLYEDTESYDCGKEYREELTARLKADSLIQRRKVELSGSEAVNRLLLTSKGKLKSIVRITEAEYLSMGKELRLLVLTDYIKKEHLSAVGNPEKPVNELGVVPIFEMLRREELKHMEKTQDGGSRICRLQLAALSGTVVLLPEQAKAALEQRLEERGLKGSFTGCGDTEYYRFTLSGSEETAASLVTELFQEGYIQVLVGTKSLLGEGWDSPCINALILASFVGSFMLSNQMRGRAIRTMKGNPGKVSNIWHLICMLPEQAASMGITTAASGAAGAGRGEEAALEDGLSEDFMTLQRRFQSFPGVHYEEDIIENGLERLSRIRPPYDSAGLERINEDMLVLASRRDVLRERWKTALYRASEMELREETSIPGVRLQRNGSFYGALLGTAAGVLLSILITGLTWNAPDGYFKGIVLVLRLLPLLLVLVRYGRRLSAMIAPKRQLAAVGKGILDALHAMGQVQNRKRLRPVVKQRDRSHYSISLSGGTQRDQSLFAEAAAELFGPVENQRYLLMPKKKIGGREAYYCVPEVFGRRKEDAAMFALKVCPALGPYELVYTKSEAGKKLLLEARMKTLSNRAGYSVQQRKRYQ